ncbi:MAG: hypothetical protein QXO15_08780 [Nitrososphaerota archaeon]
MARAHVNISPAKHLSQDELFEPLSLAEVACQGMPAMREPHLECYMLAK